jgi:acetolactate synthase regulatory subunit
MTKRVAFKQADLDRALAVVTRRGLQVARIDLNDNGASIVIGEPESNRTKRNPLDRLHAA